MFRKFLAAAVAATLICLPSLGKADVPLSANEVAVTTTGALTPIQLQGQSTCSVAVTGTFTGLSATAQVTGNLINDPVITWSAASSINSGSAITSVSTNTGGVAGYRQFRINVTAIATGTANITYSCDGSNGAAASGGGASAVTQATTPWTVNTPAPAPTCGGGVCVGGNGKTMPPIYIAALANPCLSNTLTWNFFTTGAYMGTSGSPSQLLVATSAQNGWICKVQLTNTTTSSVNITVAHSTSSVCASMTTDYMFSLAASGGVWSSGVIPDYVTPAANQQVCIYASAASSIIGAVAVLSN